LLNGTRTEQRVSFDCWNLGVISRQRDTTRRSLLLLLLLLLHKSIRLQPMKKLSMSSVFFDLPQYRGYFLSDAKGVIRITTLDWSDVAFEVGLVISEISGSLQH
jgi:hypothetical protein